MKSKTFEKALQMIMSVVLLMSSIPRVPILAIERTNEGEIEVSVQEEHDLVDDEIGIIEENNSDEINNEDDEKEISEEPNKETPNSDEVTNNERDESASSKEFDQNSDEFSERREPAPDSERVTVWAGSNSMLRDAVSAAGTTPTTIMVTNDINVSMNTNGSIMIGSNQDIRIVGSGGQRRRFSSSTTMATSAPFFIIIGILALEHTFIDGGNMHFVTVNNGGTLILGQGATVQHARHGTIAPTAWEAGIGVRNGGTLIMNHGSYLAWNHGRFGGAVRVGVDSTFIMNGGVIRDNQVNAQVGAGVYVAGGTFIMNDGEIRNNRANQGAGLGGAVVVRTAGTFVMNGGEIRNNYSNYGGGVHLTNHSNFTMNGGEIRGNRGRGGGVHLTNHSNFTMNGGRISENPSHINGGAVFVEGNSTFILEDGEIENNTGTHGGAVWARNASFYMFGGTISGNNTTGNTGSGGAMQLENDATFIMEGGEISHNRAVYGGAINIHNRATVMMRGGIIRDNEARSLGGSIRLQGGNTFVMSGGTISGNTASQGGGVHIPQNARFEMNGGVIENHINNGNGGGVSLVSGSTFIMRDGIIRGNRAFSGGGVNLPVGATFEMHGGEISENEATNGGGIDLSPDTTFEMHGGDIRANEATNGGGIRSQGTLFIDGGTISENIAEVGGGIHQLNTGSVSISNARIIGNVATNGGGLAIAVNLPDSMSSLNVVNIEDSLISENSANQGGGAIGILSGDAVVTTLNGVTLSRNTSESGGAINRTGRGSLHINDTNIYENSATTGGGIYTENLVNIRTAETTIFGGNTASNVWENVIHENDQIRFSSLSIGENPINNYDIATPINKFTVNFLDRDRVGALVQQSIELGVLIGETVDLRDFLPQGERYHFQYFTLGDSSTKHLEGLESIDGTSTVNIFFLVRALFFQQTPESIYFEDASISSRSVIAPRSDGWDLIVRDTRVQPGSWAVTATLSQEFKNESGEILRNVLIYVDANGNDTIFSKGDPITVFSHTTESSEDEIAVTWDENKGILLRIDPSSLIGVYAGEITWTLVDAP